ncbi:DNA repair protein RecO [Kineococcus sp. SYSU DK003]|uniref:DNA repair protein RecO n=1 Tax=Kineococcus sp. SYSU DK003 TaxID=3383124 RepID=UPI003D7C4510
MAVRASGSSIGGAKSYRDEAVVLRATKLGEADRIVSLLTRHHGRVRAVAKGVRRTSSRFGARLEPFTYVDVQLHRGRSLDTITQVDVIAPYGQVLAADYGLYTVGHALLETAERFTEVERENATQQHLLLVGALRTLTRREHDAPLVLDAYLLRSLAIAGYAASFADCARCGEPGPHAAFHVAAGGAVCTPCRPPGSAAPDPQTLELLAALLTGDWSVADETEERCRKEGSGLVAAFLQWHLERGIRSLRHVEREESMTSR